MAVGVSDNRLIIRNTLDMRKALEFYGIKFNRSGFASCPFHSEKTASFSAKGAYFHCFGCGLSGDLVSFVSRYFGITHREAIEKINIDFNLGLPFLRSSKPSERLASAKKMSLMQRQIRAEEQKLKSLEKAVEEAESRYISAWRITQDKAYNNAENISRAYSTALHLLPVLEYKYDIAYSKLNEYLVERGRQ